MANAILSTEVKDVLSRATASGNVLVLPQGQLDRKLYEAVDKALKNAGGKWKRGTGHVFPTEAGPKLLAMLGSGVSVDEKKRDQAFFTPAALAKRVVEIADVGGHEVLEPSAGMGALADACQDADAASVTCFEINKEYWEHLFNRFIFAHNLDFLATIPDEGWAITKDDVDYATPFDRIVMNPPFTKNQDIKHVQHALKYWLQPGGVLVSLMMPNQDRKGFQEIVDEYDPEIIEVERGAFKESGTDISTVIVKILAVR